ncbi:MAG: hypothetical protein JW844_04675 [Candidatus Omnitrophica bacterium]|nr:hypothetical protein [Candidatus Omnitrophota bacterium]
MRAKVIIYWLILFTSLSLAGLTFFNYFHIKNERDTIEEALSNMELAIESMRLSVSEYEVERLQYETLLEKERTRSVLCEADVQEAVREKEQLRKEIADLKMRLDETETLLKEARSSMGTLWADQADLAAQLAALTVAKRELEEERLKLEGRLQNIATQKGLLWNFGKEARQARERALAAEDRLGLSLGNRGYVVRGGQSTLDKKIDVKVLPADL